jgi:integrase
MEKPTKMSSLFECYLSRARLVESSIAIKRTAMRYFCEVWGDMVPGAVNYGHIEDFAAWLGKGRSATSVGIYLANLRPVFSWAVKRGYLAANPMELKRPTVGRTRRPTFETPEIERLIRIASPLWQAYIGLGLCSMRRGEILNLNTVDVDFEKCWVQIRRKLCTPTTWAWDIKDHSEALVPMPVVMPIGDTILPLQQCLADRINEAGGQPYLMLRASDYRAAMRRKTAGTLDYRRRNCPYIGFSRDFRSLQRRAGVEPKRFHDLRRTFATRMAGQLRIEETQRLMRHSSPQTTLKYYIEVDEGCNVRSAAKLLSKCYATNVL